MVSVCISKFKLLFFIILMLIISVIPLTIAKKINFHRQSLKRQQNKHENISRLLDKLLENYDNSLRPNFGLDPAVVEVDLMVRSMGPVSEIEMTYSMDCYFRQSWVDTRLAFEDHSSNITTLALSISMLAKIWKPDTFFFNGKHSYLHTITTPNKFVRLFKDGRVLYSSRLTIKAACPMNLENFPMDVQRCPLKLGSFGYTTSDVLYRWNSERKAVAISDDMTMSQFNLIEVPTSNVTDRVLNLLEDIELNVKNIDSIKDNENSLSKEYSMLLVSFHLQRHMGNFLIQVYGPCILLVVLSWVSFWLNREATADRVSLGITTVLTMTFLGLEARTDLPKVPYPTALDFFVFLSFVFIFATILQFAVVHYFTKYGSGECYFNFHEDSSESESSEDENELSTSTSGCIHQRIENLRRHSRLNNSNSIAQLNDNYGEVIPLSVCTIPSLYDESEEDTLTKIKRILLKWCSTSSSLDDFDNSVSSRIQFEETFLNSPSSTISQNPQSRKHSIHSMRRHRNPHRRKQFNSVSKIDQVSRVVFPLLFLFINLFYWYIYLSRSKRMSKQI